MERAKNLRQGEAIELEIPSSPEYVGLVRHAVESIARRMKFDQDSIEDLKLAVGEACNNAVRYSCPDNDFNSITVRCIITGDGLWVEVSNTTSACDFSLESAMPAPESEGGRGLYLIRKLMDEVDLLRDSGTAVIKMHKRLPNAAA